MKITNKDTGLDKGVVEHQQCKFFFTFLFIVFKFIFFQKILDLFDEELDILSNSSEISDADSTSSGLGTSPASSTHSPGELRLKSN